MSSDKGDFDGGGSSAFLFVPKNMESCCNDIRLCIVNFNHIYVTMGIHRKLVGDGGIEGICEKKGIEEMGLSNVMIFIGGLLVERRRSRVRIYEGEKGESESFKVG